MSCSLTSLFDEDNRLFRRQILLRDYSLAILRRRQVFNGACDFVFDCHLNRLFSVVRLSGLRYYFANLRRLKRGFNRRLKLF